MPFGDDEKQRSVTKADDGKEPKKDGGFSAQISHMHTIVTGYPHTLSNLKYGGTSNATLTTGKIDQGGGSLSETFLGINYNSGKITTDKNSAVNISFGGEHVRFSTATPSWTQMNVNKTNIGLDNNPITVARYGTGFEGGQKDGVAYSGIALQFGYKHKIPSHNNLILEGGINAGGGSVAVDVADKNILSGTKFSAAATKFGVNLGLGETNKTPGFGVYYSSISSLGSETDTREASLNIIGFKASKSFKVDMLEVAAEVGLKILNADVSRNEVSSNHKTSISPSIGLTLKLPVFAGKGGREDF